MTNTMCNDTKKHNGTPPVRWEQVSCNLCGRDDTELYHRERLPYFDIMLDFQIVRCRHCGLVYTNPRLSDHNATYLNAGCSDPEIIESHDRAKAAVFTTALDRIETLLNSRNVAGADTAPRLLDVGCGSGHFMAAARARGFDVCGIEPASASADYAARKFNIPVIRENILDTELPAESFDVITALDVIEHVSDPQAVLRCCAGWLKPGGIITLRFPSANWQKIKAVVLHRMLARSRAVFAPTIHLYFFSEKTFTDLAQKVGLNVLYTKTTATEPNTDNYLLDYIKVISHLVIRGFDALSGTHLGNLEVYCRKDTVARAMPAI